MSNYLVKFVLLMSKMFCCLMIVINKKFSVKNLVAVGCQREASSRDLSPTFKEEKRRLSQSLNLTQALGGMSYLIRRTLIIQAFVAHSFNFIPFLFYI